MNIFIFILFLNFLDNFMNKSQIIKILLFFSDYRFATKGRKEREIYLMQFSTKYLQNVLESKISKLYRIFVQ